MLADWGGGVGGHLAGRDILQGPTEVIRGKVQFLTRDTFSVDQVPEQLHGGHRQSGKTETAEREVLQIRL